MFGEDVSCSALCNVLELPVLNNHRIRQSLLWMCPFRSMTISECFGLMNMCHWVSAEFNLKEYKLTTCSPVVECSGHKTNSSMVILGDIPDKSETAAWAIKVISQCGWVDEWLARHAKATAHTYTHHQRHSFSISTGWYHGAMVVLWHWF